MKGIILAGGSGTRLYPITRVVSKQLVSVYDKPMIYYPLSVLMEAEIKDVLVISTPDDTERFQKLLGDGSSLGMNITYEVQPSPDGLAQAFLIGEKFINGDSCCMILGDNIFHGAHLKENLIKAKENASQGKATIFGYHVSDPERFGIVEFDNDGNVISVEEKPINPKSEYAITGLYFYDNTVVEKAKQVKPSKRNELEITDLNDMYLKENNLNVICLNNGYAWFDTGTFESLHKAASYVMAMQNNQNTTICCPEEIAYLNGWINKEDLIKAGELMKKNSYGQHLLSLAEKEKIKTLGTNNIKNK